MATQTMLSIGEYLETSYQPDREYLDGELRERNVGKYEHARLQALLTIWIGTHEKAWESSSPPSSAHWLPAAVCAFPTWSS